MINLSLFDGIPTTERTIKEQWENHINNPKKYGILSDCWLIQKKEIKGKYKGYVCLWEYANKPKSNNFLRIKKLKVEVKK